MTGFTKFTHVYTPKAYAEISILPAQGIRIGWYLFWRALWAWLLRRQEFVTFQMGQDAPPYSIERRYAKARHDRNDDYGHVSPGPIVTAEDDFDPRKP